MEETGGGSAATQTAHSAGKLTCLACAHAPVCKLEWSRADTVPDSNQTSTIALS